MPKQFSKGKRSLLNELFVDNWIFMWGKKRNEEEGGQIMNVTKGARGLDSTGQKK